MPTFDLTIHFAELLVLAGAAIAIFRGGVGMRDAVHDLTGAVGRLNESHHDHEERLRALELGGGRRSSVRREVDR
jgi:hypothetical protein